MEDHPASPIYCSKCSHELPLDGQEHCPACGKFFSLRNPFSYRTTRHDPKAFEKMHRRHSILFILLCGLGILIVAAFVAAAIYVVLHWKTT